MGRIRRKSNSDIKKMREAGRLVAQGLELIREKAEAGVTTGELDAQVEDLWRSQGAEPAFKGYRGFPSSICTSINEQVVHGIPGERELKSGDLLSVDAGVFYEGFAGDAAVTVAIGECSEEALELMRVTKESLGAAVEALRPNVKVSDVSRAVQEVVEGNGFSVVRRYTGHGIGRDLHEDPQVPNFVSKSFFGGDPKLPRGTTVAIEPMVTAGDYETRSLEDGWTVVTADGSLAAHFEHTIAVRAKGAEILTKL